MYITEVECYVNGINILRDSNYRARAKFLQNKKSNSQHGPNEFPHNMNTSTTGHAGRALDGIKTHDNFGPGSHDHYQTQGRSKSLRSGWIHRGYNNLLITLEEPNEGINIDDIQEIVVYSVGNYVGYRYGNAIESVELFNSDKQKIAKKDHTIFNHELSKYNIISYKGPASKASNDNNLVIKPGYIYKVFNLEQLQVQAPTPNPQSQLPIPSTTPDPQTQTPNPPTTPDPQTQILDKNKVKYIYFKSNLDENFSLKEVECYVNGLNILRDSNYTVSATFVKVQNRRGNNFKEGVATDDSPLSSSKPSRSIDGNYSYSIRGSTLQYHGANSLLITINEGLNIDDIQEIVIHNGGNHDWAYGKIIEALELYNSEYEKIGIYEHTQHFNSRHKNIISYKGFTNDVSNVDAIITFNMSKLI